MSEPAAYSNINTVAKLNGYFNWTFTYKSTSDFKLSLGRIVKIKEHPAGPALENYIEYFGQNNRHLANKTIKEFKAAWFVSNCHSQSRREDFVKAMQKNGIIVDIYGKCGNFSCPKESQSSCLELLNTHYKFYLSFENSICDDYVTEKYYYRLP